MEIALGISAMIGLGFIWIVLPSLVRRRRKE